MLDRNQIIENLILAIRDKIFDIEIFGNGVRDYFLKNPRLNSQPLPHVHSVKSRLKVESHLKEKLLRKWNENEYESVTTDNIFSVITDIYGIRVLHLHQSQFSKIHREIMDKVTGGDWEFVEPPIAYSWDPESAEHFKSLNLEVKIRETYYTSIHYLVKPPNKNNPICCEIQVRTLFEEIWGEIDHTLNYPQPTGSIACREQLRVLSKLASTGTRLADSIFKSYEEHRSQNSDNTHQSEEHF
jgi:putative GTP pyrophosphokinase